MNLVVSHNAKVARTVLLVTSCLLLLACLATGLSNLSRMILANTLVGSVQLSFAFVFAHAAWCAYQNRHQMWHNITVMYGYGFLIILTYAMFPPGSTVIQWWYTIPLMSFLLLTRRHSIVFCALLLAIGSLILARNNMAIHGSYWHGDLGNLMFPYVIVLLIADVYQKMRHKNERELTKLAMTDTLTGAFNRKALTLYFEQHKQARSSLALVDIDHFKAINDTYGHDAGDCVLKAVTEVFKNTLSPEQVYRLGGEEFVLILNGTPSECHTQLAKIHRQVAELAIHYEQDVINVKFSAGIITIKPTGSLTQDLKQADELLYQAKENGRNQLKWAS